MSIWQMRSRAAVLEAIAEYDRLGASAFLARYGFGPSWRYRLVHEGRDYDSKAIVGVAHGVEFPTEGPLRSGDFSGGVHGAAAVLRRLGFEVVDQGGSEPSGRSAQSHRRVPDAVALPARQSSADIVLVGCVKTKRRSAAMAQDLYTSELFQRRRSYAESTGRPWFILSALHGLVRPDVVVEPYDMALGDQDESYRRAWGERVANSLQSQLGDLSGLLFEVHAGAAYADALEPPLRRHGAVVHRPVQGLSMGHQLRFYSQSPEPLAVVQELRVDEDIAAVAARILSDEASVRPAREFPWGDGRLGSAGLYSWWVDPEGAVQLSAGLGLPVAPGLLYAGQAGATTTRSGTVRAATLVSRIGGNHLRGRISSSTWRRSLAAIITDQIALDFDMAPAQAERTLTEWMGAHLGLIAHPVSDRQLLARLETGVLHRIDPPLNLQGMPPTPVRRTLSLLRSAVP